MNFDMQEWIIIVGGAALVVVLIVLAVVLTMHRRSARRRRSDALRDRFGEEYDATVGRLGTKEGEAELDDRTSHFRDMELERVSPGSRDESTERWKEAQYRFLEDPAYSVREAEHLISGLMRERGFPDGGFDERARALSMAHPELADPYREAYATFRSTEDGNGTVAEMFDAMLRYRGLFEALLERPEREEGVEGSPPPRRASGPETTRSGTGRGDELAAK